MFAVLLAAWMTSAAPDDWYYPEEEPAERAATEFPRLVAIRGTTVSLATGNAAKSVDVPLGGAPQRLLRSELRRTLPLIVRPERSRP